MLVSVNPRIALTLGLPPEHPRKSHPRKILCRRLAQFTVRIYFSRFRAPASTHTARIPAEFRTACHNCHTRTPADSPRIRRNPRDSGLTGTSRRPNPPGGREPGARQTCCPVAPKGLPDTRNRCPAAGTRERTMPIRAMAIRRAANHAAASRARPRRGRNTTEKLTGIRPREPECVRSGSGRRAPSETARGHGACGGPAGNNGRNMTRMEIARGRGPT